jgi:hypothetical protein
MCDQIWQFLVPKKNKTGHVVSLNTNPLGASQKTLQKDKPAQCLCAFYGKFKLVLSRSLIFVI